MDQQAGGVMVSRGSGDTASELLARRLDDRLTELRRRSNRSARRRLGRRQHRTRAFRVALAGYTNAGKTSLMNALCHAELSVRDRPFETLDTTTRCLTRHGGDVLLSDTVGFIRRLPDRLFASFESTLAEITEASLLLVVVDVADPELEEHLRLIAALLGSAVDSLVLRDSWSSTSATGWTQLDRQRSWRGWREDTHIWPRAPTIPAPWRADETPSSPPRGRGTPFERCSFLTIVVS